MKRFLILVSAFLLGASAFVASAQMQQLPNDPAVKVGKLENGLTYYIRHNDKPAGRAEFYLATNVGAIQETPDQDGLAHFLEHMCFNGTKNFPDKGILNWLQSIGASFGGIPVGLCNNSLAGLAPERILPHEVMQPSLVGGLQQQPWV